MLHNSTVRTTVRTAVAGLATAGLLALAPTGTADAATTGTATTHHKVHHKKKRHLTARAAKVHKAFRIVLAQKGDPYRYGAAGPDAFDCSGLTSYAYHRAGLRGLPRTSSAQARFVHRIPRSRMHVGDLVFFHDGGGVYHVGVYDGSSHGRRYIVHAPYSGARVRREAIWTNSWFAGTVR